MLPDGHKCLHCTINGRYQAKKDGSNIQHTYHDCNCNNKLLPKQFCQGKYYTKLALRGYLPDSNNIYFTNDIYDSPQLEPAPPVEVCAQIQDFMDYYFLIGYQEHSCAILMLCVLCYLYVYNNTKM